MATHRCQKLMSGPQLKRCGLLKMVMAIAMMMLAPSVMKAQKITIDFQDAALGAYSLAAGTNTSYYGNIVQGADYSAIGNGAKVGDVINYKYGNTSSVDISRLAFAVNANGKGNARNEGAGFYLRREKVVNTSIAGLFTGSWNNRIAILNLGPGDKVKVYAQASNEDGTEKNLGIKYITSVHADTDGNDMYGNDNAWPNTNTINIQSAGDLILQVNKDVYITKIEIEPVPEATYTLTTVGNTSTFEFTGAGRIYENDFAVPYMSVSFGNVNDNLIVDNNGGNYQSRMLKSDGTETLETDASTNFQPSAGNFYAFRPTGGGEVTIEGGIQGNCVHLFVYDPNPNVKGWVECQPNVFYKETFNAPSNHYGSFTFTVEKDKIYYVCINNQDQNEHGNAFHLHKFSFTNTFHLTELAKVVDLDQETGSTIFLTQIQGAGGLGQNPVHVKKCSGNIDPTRILPESPIDQYGNLSILQPTFLDETKDKAGTIILDINTQGGEATYVVTFPYHANYGWDEATGRSAGHTWNFIDPRNSDSNSGNSKVWDGYSGFNDGPSTTGILSIGQYKNVSSQMRHETDDREWTYSQRQTGSAGGFHDPYYANVYDMEGDNADMIWETEGLWFDTGTNLSCIYNEKDAYDQSLTNPLDFAFLGTDPDRYVGLMPVTDGKKSSFTIPGLKPGDRVLIFMKSGEATGTNGIFLNITGAKDALGKAINPSDLYKAGGTNWQHERYEGCYHFIKDETTDPNSEYGRMTFSMNSGSMCKLLYIRIYTGQRIVTTNIVSSATGDAGRLLFMNDKGAALGSDGQGSQMSLRFRGKGQHSTYQVLTYSGNLNAASFTGDNFKVTGAYSHLIDFKSKVGEIGMFRLRMNDIEYSSNYVADFCDRNFTVGYRDKVDEYPYTWDFTDIQGFSSDKMSTEAGNYPIAAASQDAYGHEWDISLFDENGNMKVNTGYDPITNNLIFSPHKIGFGNQLWAGGNVIPETRGLWFYSEDDSETGYTSEYSSALYNDCLQITSDGIRFANVPDQAGKRVAWWNYKMVVPDVPADGAVYLRMKRDTSVPDNAKTFSTIDNADVPFLAARFQFASQSSKTDMVKAGELKNGTNYSFYKVPNTTDEYIVAVKNTTGNVNHLTFTLNGWIVKKVAVSTYQKTVNKLGWATESRNRFIDPELTPFFTGEGVETCTVTGFDYPNKTVTLKRVAVANYVMKPVSNDNNEAYLIHNTNDKAVQILDDGFHLFVPDMHDYVDGGNSNVKTPEDMSNSKLKAQLNEGDVSSTDNAGNTNFVLTYKFRQVDSNDNVVSGVQEANEVSFYRVLSSVHSKGNQGYLPVPTSEWKKKTSSTAKFALIFVDEEEEETGVVTGVESVSLQSAEKDVFYNLNGQKLNGAPTESGIYIRNGKKVLVKMF